MEDDQVPNLTFSLHELNNQLTNILLSVDVLNHLDDGDARQFFFYEIIRKNALVLEKSLNKICEKYATD